MNAGLLPPGYEALEPFVAQWDASGIAARAKLRDESTPEQRLAFHAAARGLVPGALAKLDEKPLDQLDEREQRLARLLLSYAHVAMAVEIRGAGEAAHMLDRRESVLTHEPAGL
ncbi:MAG: hypothetical protein KGN34_13055 [Sphingomonadales bacterium]|nr:hypothetical protein [Sphingomonadales bacterium]